LLNQVQPNVDKTSVSFLLCLDIIHFFACAHHFNTNTARILIRPKGEPPLDTITHLKKYGYHTVVMDSEFKDEFPMDDVEPIQDAIEQGDRLPNTPSSLEARVVRRALVVSPVDIQRPTYNTYELWYKVVVQHNCDWRNTYGGSVFLSSAPTDASRVYRMLCEYNSWDGLDSECC
jgi:hypothetical protein